MIYPRHTRATIYAHVGLVMFNLKSVIIRNACRRLQRTRRPQKEVAPAAAARRQGIEFTVSPGLEIQGLRSIGLGLTEAEFHRVGGFRFLSIRFTLLLLISQPA